MFFHARLVSILLVINAFLAQNSVFGYKNHIFILSLFSEKNSEKMIKT